jgi:hypothetical protein
MIIGRLTEILSGEEAPFMLAHWQGNTCVTTEQTETEEAGNEEPIFTLN